MPIDASITGTPLGAITGTIVNADDGTITGSIGYVAVGTLSSSVGVPGPQGEQGPQGQQGEPGQDGAPGVGVPAGGSAGQVLAKVDGVDYNTEWVNVQGDYLPLAGGTMDTNALVNFSDGTNDSQIGGWGFGVEQTGNPSNYSTVESSGITVTNGSDSTYLFPIAVVASNGTSEITVTPTGITFPDSTVQTSAYLGGLDTKRGTDDYDFTNVPDVKLSTYGLTLVGPTNDTIPYGSYLAPNGLVFSQDSTDNGSQEGVQYLANYLGQNIYCKSRQLVDVDGTLTWQDEKGYILSGGDIGLKFLQYNGTLYPSSVQYQRSQIIFGNGSTQTIAFPGFNNAALTGNPTAPTPATSDNDTSIATTAFVKAQGYLTTSSSGAVPSGGTAGQVLTKGSSTSYDLNWSTPSVGDKYYSTSTTSLSVSNGTKTLTIATGLSYTTQQSVIVAYDATHHMHGTVTSYNSTTGVMVVDVTQHTGTGTYSLWTVNVGGISSTAEWGLITGTLSAQTDLQAALDAKLAVTTAASTYYPLSSNPAGYLTSAPVTSVAGRTGAITLAVADVSGAAPLASPSFTGTPSLPTGTTAVTQTAGDNTTKLATTAFVTAAVPAFATNAQIITGTSTSTVIAPSNAGFFLANPKLRSLAAINQTAISGSGAVTANSGFTFRREMYLSTLATGRASYSYGTNGTAGFGGSTANRDQIDFSKKVWMSGYASMGNTGATSYIGDANTICRITLGGYSSVTTGDMTVAGIGIKKVGGASSVVVLTVHNGTGLSDVSSSITVPDSGGINWMIYSDGTGNVTLYINGSQAATTSSGPTGTTTANNSAYREQVEAVATPGVRQSMNCSGGWVYLT